MSLREDVGENNLTISLGKKVESTEIIKALLGRVGLVKLRGRMQLWQQQNFLIQENRLKLPKEC